mmetsp:Transcript_11781/g.13685  ORF Transcript_11781/g.13685 Transcript_11781/m.13685 type:complete len:151 (-) Transcript_11781:121-573(-)
MAVTICKKVFAVFVLACWSINNVNAYQGGLRVTKAALAAEISTNVTLNNDTTTSIETDLGIGREEAVAEQLKNYTAEDLENVQADMTAYAYEYQYGPHYRQLEDAYEYQYWPHYLSTDEGKETPDNKNGTSSLNTDVEDEEDPLLGLEDS